MIGYEMSSSSVGVYTIAKASLEELQAWMKNDMDAKYGNTCCYGSSPEVKFLGQPQTLDKKTWPLENSNLRLTPPPPPLNLVRHTNCCLK